ncbi:MAG: hypothetical protein GQ577_08765 [Woeseiaceae bacterium]|jgi:hypothetical protein|nr:hypothetical protein [Woeseiaceae bacterium]
MKQASRVMKLTAFLLLAAIASGCVTSTIVDARTAKTGINEGDTVVIMAKSYHLGNETELKYIRCIEENLARGQEGLTVIPHDEFVDSLFPWFEPRTAPAETKNLAKLMDRPGVADKIAEQGIRYIIWLDGDTDRVAGGGSLSCAVGPGGGGCFGFAWWQNDADYDASVWDLEGLESAGTVSADVTGTSYMPALVIPLPLIARTQSRSCKSLAAQLHKFIVQDETA